VDETRSTPRSQRKSESLDAGERDEIERIASAVIGAAIAVHRSRGPGLLESVYEACLTHELTKSGLPVERQVAVPVRYDGVELEAGFRLEPLVKGCVVVEIKAVEKLSPVHRAQLITYLRLADKRLGLLINFNSLVLKGNFERIVN